MATSFGDKPLIIIGGHVVHGECNCTLCGNAIKEHPLPTSWGHMCHDCYPAYKRTFTYAWEQLGRALRRCGFWMLRTITRPWCRIYGRSGGES